MDELPLETLFERFRRGDAEALGTVFDRTGTELLRVALHLSPDLSAAEDLVQATFVAAIEGRERFQRGRRLMPWLLGILGNRARLAHRDARRRPDPGRLPQEPPADPARGAEDREVARAVRRAVGELPDAYRAVVGPHLLDGRRAVDLAHELGRAPGTVRMQIARGLRFLRQRLPEGWSAGAALVAFPGRGEAALRGVVVARAEAALAAAPIAFPMLPAALAGGLSLTVKMQAVLAGVAAACLGTWWTMRATAPVEGERAAVVAPRETTSEPSDAVVEPAPPRGIAAEERSDAAPTGSPLPDGPEAPPASGGTWVVGRVEVPEGWTDGPVAVGLFAAGALGRRPLEPIAETEIDGDDGDRFHLHVEEAGEYVLAAAGRGLAPDWCHLVVVDREPVEAPTLVLDEGRASLRGTVALPAALARSRVLVAAARRDVEHDAAGDDWRALRWTGHAFEAMQQRVHADGRRQFVLGGLTPGARYEVWLDEVEDVDYLVLDSVEASAPGAGLVLGAGAWLFTLDVTGGSAPLAGAEVRFGDEGGHWSTTTGAGGRKSALWEVARSLTASARMPGRATVEETLAATTPGAHLHRTFELADRSADLATLAIEVVLPEGESLPALEAAFARTDDPSAHVRWTHWNPRVDGVERRQAEPADGTFVFEHLEPGTYVVGLSPWDGDRWSTASHLVPTELAVTLPPGARERRTVRFELGGIVTIVAAPGCPRDARPGAAIRDSSGASPLVLFVHRAYEGGTLSIGGTTDSLSLATRCTVLPVLPPGSYTLELELEGVELECEPFAVEPGRDVEVVVRRR